MADLTAKPQPDAVAEEVRRQVFALTGHSLTDMQLVGVVRALAVGASFDAFVQLMVAGFSDPARIEETRQALDAFARLPPDPVS